MKTNSALRTPNSALHRWLALLAFVVGIAITPAMTCRNQADRFEPGGAYARTNAAGQITVDFPLFYADTTFEAAHRSLDFAFKFERDNRKILWAVSHDIKHGLDQLRPQAALIVRKYGAARAAYLAAPGDGSLGTVEDIVRELQKLAAGALAVIESNNQP